MVRHAAKIASKIKQLSFLQLSFAVNGSEPKLYGIIAIGDIRKIHTHEQIYLSYGVEYTFQNCKSIIDIL